MIFKVSRSFTYHQPLQIRLFVQFYSSWQDFTIYRASRGPSAKAGLQVLMTNKMSEMCTVLRTWTNMSNRWIASDPIPGLPSFPSFWNGVRGVCVAAVQSTSERKLVCSTFISHMKIAQRRCKRPWEWGVEGMRWYSVEQHIPQLMRRMRMSWDFHPCLGTARWKRIWCISYRW